MKGCDGGKRAGGGLVDDGHGRSPSIERDTNRASYDDASSAFDRESQETVGR